MNPIIFRNSCFIQTLHREMQNYRDPKSLQGVVLFLGAFLKYVRKMCVQDSFVRKHLPRADKATHQWR